MRKILCFVCCIVILLCCVSCNHSGKMIESEDTKKDDHLDISIYCLGPDVKGITDYSENETIRRIE